LVVTIVLKLNVTKLHLQAILIKIYNLDIMDKLINDFRLYLFIWQIVIFVGLIFTKKNSLGNQFLMPLMIEKKELKRITFC
jgi:hypothetical protein